MLRVEWSMRSCCCCCMCLSCGSSFQVRFVAWFDAMRSVVSKYHLSCQPKCRTCNSCTKSNSANCTFWTANSPTTEFRFYASDFIVYVMRPSIFSKTNSGPRLSIHVHQFSFFVQFKCIQILFILPTLRIHSRLKCYYFKSCTCKVQSQKRLEELQK